MSAKRKPRGLRSAPPAETAENNFHSEKPEILQASSTRPPASASLDRAEQGLRRRAYQEIPTEQIELTGRNRYLASYEPETEALFREDIERHGGNEVPAVVRPHPNPKPDGPVYQLVYGHRRFYACRDLGLPLRAYVRERSDAELFADRLRENSNRVDQPPYERALLMREALELGAVSNQRELAALTGTTPATVSYTLALADLPASVLSLVGEQPGWLPLKLGYRIGAEAREREETVDRLAQEVLLDLGPAEDEEGARTRLKRLEQMLSGRGETGQKGSSTNRPPATDDPGTGTEVASNTDSESVEANTTEQGKAAGTTEIPEASVELRSGELESGSDSGERQEIEIASKDGNVRARLYTGEHGRTVIEFNVELDAGRLRNIAGAIERGL